MTFGNCGVTIENWIWGNDYRELEKGLRTIGNSGVSTKKPSTPWRSRAVPQPSTTLALHRLAMEFEWDPAFSMQYGRRLIDYRFW